MNDNTVESTLFKETTLMSKRIDEIRGRLRYRRHLPIYTPSMAAVENKNDLYDWSFRGTYHDALFMAHAVDDIRFLLGEIERMEAEAEGDAEDD